MSLINLNALRERRTAHGSLRFHGGARLPQRRGAGAGQCRLPAIDTAANHSLENLQYGPAFAALMEEMQGTDFATALGETF